MMTSPVPLEQCETELFDLTNEVARIARTIKHPQQISNDFEPWEALLYAIVFVAAVAASALFPSAWW